jgi:heme-degrading monooxygenase HmoA
MPFISTIEKDPRMHARVSPIESDGPYDEAAFRRMHDDLVPKVLGLPGNLGIIMLQDVNGGRAMSITLWEDEDAVRASDQASATLRHDATSQINSRQSAESRVYTVSGFDLKPGATM